MSASLLLTPPTSTSPQQTLALSQQASAFLASQSTFFNNLPYPLSLLFSNESQEKWQIHENLFLACLRTGDDKTAALLLEALKSRFGRTNERVMALDGMYREATATDDKELMSVLKRYDEILEEDPTMFAIRKRRAALLRSLGKVNEAVKALTELLDASPTDAEAWSELADVYLTLGAFEQSVYCLEEVLLVMPNAWNMHARLGEVLFLQAQKVEGGDALKGLAESMRRFCRSVELCDDYLRGYYGLKLTTTRLLSLLQDTSKPSKASSDQASGDLAPPTVEAVKKLNELATSKLAEIVRRGSSGEKGRDGYSQSELIAARALLDGDTQKVDR